jgi:para-nitrobenzyl esterase
MNNKRFPGWKRPARLAALALLPLAGLVLQGHPSRAAEPAPVSIEGGLIAGKAVAGGEAMLFAGIPYAAPPVGGLRWKATQPPSSWTGVRPATDFGPGCMQPRATADRLPWTMEYLHQGRIDEDCLYLNVWIPARAAGQPMPVVVFIHGGGFVEGSGGVPVYDGAAMARQGVVFVTINYRLGVFGHLAHPALTQEAGASGNYAFHDQLAALRWVKANIDRFGGDAANVTVMGQSAGANAILVLNASPLAKGLYAKAIMESAPGTTITNYGIRPAEVVGMPLAEAEQKGEAWAKQAGLASLAELRAAPADKVLQLSSPNPPVRGAVIDGRLLPDRISTIMAKGQHNDVAILAGTVRDERGSEADYGTWSRAQLEDYARRAYPNNRDVFLRAYPAADDASAREQQKAVLRDERRFALNWLANLRASTGTAGSYLYFFDRPTPWPAQPRFGAFHSSELPYVLGNQAMLDRPWEPLDRSLSATMQAYWVNFARTGNPNGPELPEWQPFGAANRRMIWLGENLRMVDVISADTAAMVAEKKE